MIGHDSSLLNLVGHSTGALIFGIFLFLLSRDRAGARLPERRLTVTAAGLAFAWNLGALVLNAISAKPSVAGAVVELLSYSSLSMLAPVLLHLSLNRQFALTAAAYAAGGLAVVLHVAEVVLHRPEYHLYALSVIAIGLGAVTLVSGVHLVRSAKADRRSLARPALGAACLFVFMVTYLHLGLAHGAPEWSNELVLHHASVPLALLIILHNHRFVLLDALIRFCANAALAGVFTFVALHLVEAEMRRPAGSVDISERATSILGTCLVLLVFAFARERLQRLLTRVVFRRGDAAALSHELRAKGLDGEAAYLPWAVEQIAGWMRAERVTVVPETLAGALKEAGVSSPSLAVHLSELRKALETASVEVVIPMGDSFLLLGRRRGGQPYMSEDLQNLGHFASIIMERLQAFRQAEMRSLADRAELRALQAQINPHFLFNALNAIYGLVPKQAAEARETVLNLSDLFRYFLKNDEAMIPLEQELHIVEAYLQIEGLRLGGRLRKEIEVAEEALRVPIPKLAVQPLVENAVKHGIAPHNRPGLVSVRVRMNGAGLEVTVRDTGSGPAEAGAPGAGVGLQNVARRLELCYGPECRLEVRTDAGGTSAGFTVPVAKAAEARA